MKRLSGMSLVVTLALVGGIGCEEGDPSGGDGGLVDGGSSMLDGGEGGIADGGGGGADVAPGLKALTPVRRTGYRRITNFPRGPEARFITDAKISADGSTIIFSTVAGTYTIAADGTKMVQLSPKRNDGLVDITADGKKVVWYDDVREGWVAASDGSGKVKLAGTHAVAALRMTAAGDKIYEVAPEAGGVIELPADGGALKVLMTTAAVAMLNGVDANGNHWRGVLDISDDGSKVVFVFLWDAFSMTGAGTDLKQLTQFLMPEKRILKLVRLSGNGAKVAWNLEDGARSTVAISDFGGGNKIEYVGQAYEAGAWLRLSRDASKAVLGWGIRLLDTTKLLPYDAIDAGSGSIPLGRPAMVTLTADARRAALVVEGPESTDQGRPHQIVVVDFDPATPPSYAPTIEGTATNLEALPNDGSKRASVFATVRDADLSEVHTVGLRGGFRLGQGITPWMHWALEDAGANGDVTAKDQTFSTNGVGLTTDKMIVPGPFTLRFVAANKAGHVLMVDTEGLQSAAP